MTQEEKAKAYDEALDRAKKELQTCGSTDCDAARQIFRLFLQLRESEDERIKNGLIGVVSDITGGWPFENHKITKKEAITYLEKQKEHSMSAEEVLAKAGLKPYKDGNQWCILAGDNIQEGVCGFGDTIEDALYEFLKEVLDFQKEQKPESCDCSRDEESYTNGIHHVLMNPEAYGLIKQKPAEQLGGTFTSYDMAKTFTEGQNYVIAHPEKFGLCKPVEWSEEDDWKRKELIQYLEEKGDYRTVWMTWLKSLPERFVPQSKQEWSEDYDEENLQTRFAFYTYKDDPSVLYLSNVFVEETSRNHGFGTRILKAAEKVAEAIGAITIRLKVKQDSPANNWYRKHGYAYMTFEDGYDWLEKNLEYMKPNKQEWSEEDKETIDLTIAVLKENLPNGYVKTNPANTLNMGAIHTDELINRLKSLRPVSKESLQPHEEIYQSAKHDLAIKFMNYLDENRSDGKMCLSNAESEDIDKAFKENDLAKIVRYYEKYRPHWKPSEEQMDALKDIAYGTYQNGDGPALRSLYEQLKKLR